MNIETFNRAKELKSSIDFLQSKMNNADDAYSEIDLDRISQNDIFAILAKHCSVPEIKAISLYMLKDLSLKYEKELDKAKVEFNNL